MEFISISKKHSFASGLAHILLNILLVAFSWLSIYVTKTPWIAIGLVVISKWRTLAVRPRYWVANLKSNLVDLIFSLGIVILMWNTGTEFLLSQAILAGIYAVWLLAIKPASSEILVKTQAFLAVFFGTTALFSISYSWEQAIVVLTSFIIGYAGLRHAFSASENAKNSEIVSLFWGLIFAEATWILSFLLIGYKLIIPNLFNFTIPQATIILSSISFLAFEVLTAKKGKKINDFYLTIGFVAAVCLILLLAFSSIS